MRILTLHEPYHGATPGGEDHVVRREQAALVARGIVTRLLEWPPPLSAASLGRKVLVQLRAGYSPRSRRRVRAELAAFRPDLVHVHNFWPQLTPSIHYECRRAGVPVVLTLHNYRIVCVADFLLRDGSPCERCVGKMPWRGVLHRCQRKSLARSAAKAAAFALHRAADTWNRTVDVFIAPSASMRERYVRGGLDPDRIVVNPQLAPDLGAGTGERTYFAFVGRLSPEKGIRLLLQAWKNLGDAELRLAGGGILEGEVIEAAARLPNVRHLGPLAADAAQRLMRGAIATILPSLWEEPFPLVIAESYAAATPVIAADTGSRRETVAHAETGLVFPAGDRVGLEGAVRWAMAHPSECREMGNAARRRYQTFHSVEAYSSRLISIYESVLRSRGADVRGESDDSRTTRLSVR